MNIFVTDQCPIQSARNLPDKHIVKMPLETCQMLAIIYSDWYYGIGQLHKLDGKPYATKHGAFRKHPCTIWAAESYWNLSWLISHGMALCDEYTARYNKVHACQPAITEAITIFEASFDFNVDIYKDSLPMSFTRAMPEFIKFDTTIDSITAYKRYLNTKPWLATNYLRIPSRKPSFITTMTTSTPNTSDLPVFDFSNEPSQVEVEQAKSEAYQSDEIQKAIEDAEKAMKAPSAKPLVPTKKATKKSGKAGRVVGISADENKFLKTLLETIAQDANYDTMIVSDAYTKLIARYNNNK